MDEPLDPVPGDPLAAEGADDAVVLQTWLTTFLPD